MMAKYLGNKGFEPIGAELDKPPRSHLRPSVPHALGQRGRAPQLPAAHPRLPAPHENDTHGLRISSSAAARCKFPNLSDHPLPRGPARCRSVSLALGCAVFGSRSCSPILLTEASPRGGGGILWRVDAKSFLFCFDVALSGECETCWIRCSSGRARGGSGRCMGVDFPVCDGRGRVERSGALEGYEMEEGV